MPSRIPSQSGKLSELSAIEERSEVTSQVTRKDFVEVRKRFKETPSISLVGEISQEITKEEVDRAYKKKNACTQRLTIIYQNHDIEKEMAHTDLEREAIEDFYEEYRLKYARKLGGWQEVIDMYAEQELQKIEEEKQYKEWMYKQQKEKEMQTMLRVMTAGRGLPLDSAETETKHLDVVTSIVAGVSQSRVTTVTGSMSTSTMLVSSTHIAPTPSVVESRVMVTSPNDVQQREQSRMDALRAAAGLRRSIEPTSHSQVAVTTTSAVVSGLGLEETENSFHLVRYQWVQ